MRTFLLAGFLYLVGTAVVLFTKPSLMFTDDGVWKEFGIGRNPATHTWIPFWLFAIIWAIISYILSLVIFRTVYGPSNTKCTVSKNKMNMNNGNNGNNGSEGSEDLTSLVNEGRESSQSSTIKRNNLPTGYYVLNTMTDSGQGEPNYVYLGKRLPCG